MLCSSVSRDLFYLGSTLASCCKTIASIIPKNNRVPFASNFLSKKNEIRGWICVWTFSEFGGTHHFYRMDSTLRWWTPDIIKYFLVKVAEQIIVEVLEHSTPIILLLLDLMSNNYRFLRSKLYCIIAYSFAYLIINLSTIFIIEAIH
jgi:hypothetical protein